MNEKLRTIVERLVAVYSSRLADVALDFLAIGMKMFAERRASQASHYQVALGNLAIAVELMLKSYLSRKNFLSIFEGGSTEFRFMFSTPVELPADFNWRTHWETLRSNAIPTIGMDKAISAFYVFRPDLKPSLSPHARFLSTVRNASVHAILPSFQRYDLERTAFLALSFLRDMAGVQELELAWTRAPKEYAAILTEFESTRVEKVRKRIEAARTKCSRGLNLGSTEIPEGWEFYTTHCPVCANFALVQGYTQLDAVPGTDLTGAKLNFRAGLLFCGACELKLDDSEELRLAGASPIIDRTSDLGHWLWEEGLLED
ncbi:MAG: hypothetical protein IT585_06615 [candidate division Zixibacteria bacterium]|nr:hypothetical protein [candidate division Zixibacteria bacterium]